MASKQDQVTQYHFDRLLNWLDANRDSAAQKYEQIRLRLIKLFVCRGCTEPEDLADETINRVSLKVETIADDYKGDPALYFYGVAHNVHLEHTRKRIVPGELPPATQHVPDDDNEEALDCLDQCLEKLTPANRQLVVEYYQDQKRSRIDHRKVIADRLGIGQNALRIRAHRIRATLQSCVTVCLGEQTAS